MGNNTTTLFKKTFALDFGSEQTDTLLHADIKPWIGSTAKGVIDQTFDYAIRARQSRNFITPLEYRFYFEESDNGKFLLIYRYVHSQSSLSNQIVHVYQQNGIA